LLNHFEELKKTFGIKEQPRLAKLLTQLSRRGFKDAASLIRLHESLMFMLAYPQSKELRDQTKELLASFPKRIEYLKKFEADFTPFKEPKVSGIAGTSVTVMLGYRFDRLGRYFKLNRLSKAVIFLCMFVSDFNIKKMIAPHCACSRYTVT
jgi:hypothetical protein